MFFFSDYYKIVIHEVSARDELQDIGDKNYVDVDIIKISDSKESSAFDITLY